MTPEDAIAKVRGAHAKLEAEMRAGLSRGVAGAREVCADLAAALSVLESDAVSFSDVPKLKRELSAADEKIGDLEEKLEAAIERAAERNENVVAFCDAFERALGVSVDDEPYEIHRLRLDALDLRDEFRPATEKPCQLFDGLPPAVLPEFHYAS